MTDAKNVAWILVIEDEWNLLRSSELNVFGNYEAFGFSEAVRKYEKRWVTLRAWNVGRR